MLTGPWIKTVRNGVCSGRLICSCFEAEQMRMRANPPTYAVNMPLPPPRIGPRTIIAVNGGIDLPSGNADTDPGVKSTRTAASFESTHRATAPRALTPLGHPTLRMTTDTSCGRGRFDLNQRVGAATVSCLRNVRRNGRTVGT